jgi:hypothetical protein
MSDSDEDYGEERKDIGRNRQRIGHAEREAAYDALRDAAAAGRITLDELESRVEQVNSALYATDLAEALEEITVDLPWEHPSNGPTNINEPTGTDRPGPDPAPGESADNREVLHPPWTGLIRRGRWTVAPFLRCEPAGVLLELDFLDVITELSIIDIEVSARTGTLKLIVPDSWGVDISSLNRSPIAVITFKANETPQEGSPLIRVHGKLGSGVFQARGPSRRRRRLDH